MPGTSVKLYGRKKEAAEAAAGEDARLEALAGEDESYDEYVPLRERRRREAERRAGKLGKNRRDRERELLEKERWETDCSSCDFFLFGWCMEGGLELHAVTPGPEDMILVYSSSILVESEWGVDVLAFEDRLVVRTYGTVVQQYDGSGCVSTAD